MDCHSDAMAENPEINRMRFGLPDYMKSFQWLRAAVAAGMAGFRMVDFDQLAVGKICLDNRKKDAAATKMGKRGFEKNKK